MCVYRTGNNVDINAFTLNSGVTVIITNERCSGQKSKKKKKKKNRTFS